MGFLWDLELGYSYVRPYIVQYFLEILSQLKAVTSGRAMKISDSAR